MTMLQYQDRLDETETFIKIDYEKENEGFQASLEAMVGTVEEYGKWIDLESEKDEKEMSMYQVGKLNPKNELMRNIEEISNNTINENLSLLLKHNAF